MSEDGEKWEWGGVNMKVNSGLNQMGRQGREEAKRFPEGVGV